MLAYVAFRWGGVVRTGLHYTPGNAYDLAAEAEWAWAHPEETAWSSSSHAALREILKKEKPDIAHFHNTFPLISPSAYYACARAAGTAGLSSLLPSRPSQGVRRMGQPSLGFNRRLRESARP